MEFGLLKITLGVGDLTKLNVPAGDEGGELDLVVMVIRSAVSCSRARSGNYNKSTNGRISRRPLNSASGSAS